MDKVGQKYRRGGLGYGFEAVWVSIRRGAELLWGVLAWGRVVCAKVWAWASRVADRVSTPRRKVPRLGVAVYGSVVMLEMVGRLGVELARLGVGGCGEGRPMRDAPRPLSRLVRNSLIFKTDSIMVEESKPIVRSTAGFRQQVRCHRACNQLKIPSIELGSFFLGIEILWLANGCENIGVAIVGYR
ncbi:hypothetical protein PIB30_100779 [Stylosanthes scabra]|uniref:Uncharacterized protein n=1 Tax=Stylosanthes scabra TaxID=79078 RepID=A0ABU6QXY0_9FABA|nr:hypothetical protein [Stylosanthes scabra]